jgi:hypothetical protein
MSDLYTMGASITQRGGRGRSARGVRANVGRLVWTPSAVAAEANRVDSEMVAFHGDMTAWIATQKEIVARQNAAVAAQADTIQRLERGGTDATEERARWQRLASEGEHFAQGVNNFYLAWAQFYGAWRNFHRDFDTRWGSNVEPIHDFENRLITWRQMFEQHTGRVATGPAPTAHASEGWSWTPVYIVGGIVGAIFILPALFNMLATRRATAAALAPAAAPAPVIVMAEHEHERKAA